MRCVAIDHFAVPNIETKAAQLGLARGGVDSEDNAMLVGRLNIIQIGDSEGDNVGGARGGVLEPNEGETG